MYNSSGKTCLKDEAHLSADLKGSDATQVGERKLLGLK